jgi:hypothetical protein
MEQDKHTEAAQTSEIKPGWNWKRSVVILLILPVRFFILLPLGGFFYLCGRFYPEAIYFVVLSVAPYLIFSIICFVVCTSRLFRDWKKLTRRKKLIIAAEIAIPSVLIASFVASSLEPAISWPSSRFFMYGFGERISARADVESIRAWLRTLDKEDDIDYPAPLSSDQWTEPLKELNPRSVYYSRDENGNRKVRLRWGGGIVCWGVEIGTEDMKIPPSDLRLHGEIRLPLKPGLYAW